MSENIANYQAERLAFNELVQPECERRILLFEGKSGSGKSTLLTHCRTHIPKESHHIPVDLRGTSLSLAGLFFKMMRQLKNELFRAFSDKVAELSGRSAVELKNVAQWGNENQIHVALQGSTNLSREERLAALTNAWFSDMQAVQRQCVVMMDTFEQANDEMKEWVSGDFLTEVANSENLRVMVAGQCVPDVSRIEWGHCCEKWILDGVREAIHWMPVVEALGKSIPSVEPFGFLQGICSAFEGDPAKIIEFIKRLPRKS
jgi:energy-coupling factor transporter ATP-binding protein EcfA2